MHPFYDKGKGTLRVITRHNQHYPPHLHPFLECVYLQKGTLAIGQGQDLYAMEAGDFALIFPNVLHHYQIFDAKNSVAVYLVTESNGTGTFEDLLTSRIPASPVIPAAKVDPEISHTLNCLMQTSQKMYQKELQDAYLQIILAKSIPQLTLIDRQMLGSHDLVYEVISYITAHFREEVTLTGMAQALGTSPYVLSRIFSSVFHTNFNTYLNEVRLRRADSLLKYSDMPITDIAMNCGFSSLRTFNRFAKEKLRMSPREYRAASREQLPRDIFHT